MLAHDRTNADQLLEAVLTVCKVRKQLEDNEAVSRQLRSQLDLLIVELQKAGLNFIPRARRRVRFDVKRISTWKQLREGIAQYVSKSEHAKDA